MFYQLQELGKAELDDLLVVYDADFLYGQNFFLIVTEAAKIAYLFPNGPPADPSQMPEVGGKEIGEGGEGDEGGEDGKGGEVWARVARATNVQDF